MTNTPTLEAVRLEPCPFCGGDATMIYQSGNEVMDQCWIVGCTRCAMQTKEYGSNSWNPKPSVDEAAKALAIRLWNRRAAPAVAGGGDAADAARYQWLRENPPCWLKHEGDEGNGFAAELDAAIDAARLAPPPPTLATKEPGR